MVKMELIWTQIADNFFYSSIYDILKFLISYFIGRWLYEKVYKNWRWGRWETIIRRGDVELSRRKMSPSRAEMVVRDENDLSVYLKGVISFHEWLNIDICSKKAKSTGLIVVDRDKRKIVVDLAKNPPGNSNKGGKNERKRRNYMNFIENIAIYHSDG